MRRLTSSLIHGFIAATKTFGLFLGVIKQMDSNFSDHGGSPVIDIEALHNLREVLGTEYAAVRDGFVSQLGEGVAQLGLQAEINNYAEIKKTAHRLRGSSLDMCCPQLASLFAQIEQFSKDVIDHNEIGKHPDRFSSLINQTRESVRQAIATLP